MTDDPKTPTSIVPVTDEGAAALAKAGSRLKLEGSYEGEGGLYEVYSIGGDPLVKTDMYTLAVAKNPAGQYGIAMVATSPEWNGMVDRQARVAATLQKVATRLDEGQPDPKKKPNYGASFPMALESFDTSDDRLGVFLGYHPVIKTWEQLAPVSLALAAVRMDMKSNAWLLGKYLKLLGLVHDLGFSIDFVDSSNTFMETAEHGVFILDLTNVKEDATETDQLADVAALAEMMYWAVGGEDGKEPPHDSDIMTAEQNTEYAAFLRKLMERETTAHAAMKDAYAMFDRIWPQQPGGTTGKPKRDWHPYTTHSR